jgi:L-aminopeptidase/D-esterase-like protein
VVGALVAVNAYGELRTGWPVDPPEPRLPAVVADDPFTSTTIGVLVTNGRLDKVACQLAAQSGHDGMARALSPAHTRFDGDALVCAATGAVDASVDIVRELAAATVDAAIRAALTP